MMLRLLGRELHGQATSIVAYKRLYKYLCMCIQFVPHLSMCSVDCAVDAKVLKPFLLSNLRFLIELVSLPWPFAKLLCRFIALA